jgi:hypothetical protein
VRAPLAGAFQMEGVGDLSILEPPLHIACALQHESVMAIGSVGITFAECVVDEDGKVETISQVDCHVERRILLGADRCPHPVKDELAGTK